jgi:hypothetical protein
MPIEKFSYDGDRDPEVMVNGSLQTKNWGVSYLGGVSQSRCGLKWREGGFRNDGSLSDRQFSVLESQTAYELCTRCASIDIVHGNCGDP